MHVIAKNLPAIAVSDAINTMPKVIKETIRRRIVYAKWTVSPSVEISFEINSNVRVWLYSLVFSMLSEMDRLL